MTRACARCEDDAIDWANKVRFEEPRDSGAVSLLLKYLREGDYRLKCVCLDTLAAFGTDGCEAIPDAIALLNDESAPPWVRDTAAYALGHIAGGADELELFGVIEALVWHSVRDDNIGRCADRALDRLTK